MKLTPFRRIQPEPVDTTEATRLRDARIEAARRNSRWTELDEVDLVRRGRLLVSASSDEVFTPYRGSIFARGEVRPSFQEQVALFFYVSQDGGLHFLERRPGSWSEIVEKQAKRQRTRT